MKDRIKQLRKINKETQQKFADNLNVSKSTIEAIEYGRREPTERMIKDICRVYEVHEEWLRTGEGEMFEEPLDMDDDMKVLGLLGVDPDDPFARFVLDVAKVYYTLSEDGRAAVQDFCHKVYLESEKRNKKEEDE